MGHSIAALDNFRTEGRADWDSIDRAWEAGVLAVERGGVDRVGLGLAARDLGHKDLVRRMDEPVLQPFPLSDLRQWRAMGRLRFSRANPDGLRPFETVLVLPLMGQGQGLKWVPDRLVVIPGERGSRGWVGHDTKGRTYTLRPITGMNAPRRSEHRLLAVQDVGSWLADYFSRPEPGFVTSAGEPCGPETRGKLDPRPIRIVGRIVGGGLDIRWRQDEPSQGWNLHRRQEAVEASPRPCSAKGCEVFVTGRRRWCEQHANTRTSGSKQRARWTTLEIPRSCGCGCGEVLSLEQRADAQYLNPAHKERARRKRAAA